MSTLLAVLALAAAPAFGCGVCVDDKIASCYDHAVVTTAKGRGHGVAFYAIEGDLIGSAETRRAILRAIEALPGVQRASSRVSLENAALSFAFDPTRISSETARDELARKLAPLRLGVALLRTL